jgi:hypothetical protein
MTNFLVALSELQHAQVTKLLTAFCASRVHPAVRDKLRHGFRIDGNAVELFESRPAFLLPPCLDESPAADLPAVRPTATEHPVGEAP